MDWRAQTLFEAILVLCTMQFSEQKSGLGDAVQISAQGMLVIWGISRVWWSSLHRFSVSCDSGISQGDYMPSLHLRSGSMTLRRVFFDRGAHRPEPWIRWLDLCSLVLNRNEEGGVLREPRNTHAILLDCGSNLRTGEVKG